MSLPSVSKFVLCTLSVAGLFLTSACAQQQPNGTSSDAPSPSQQQVPDDADASSSPTHRTSSADYSAFTNRAAFLEASPIIVTASPVETPNFVGVSDAGGNTAAYAQRFEVSAILRGEEALANRAGTTTGFKFGFVGPNVRSSELSVAVQNAKIAPSPISEFGLPVGAQYLMFLKPAAPSGIEGLDYSEMFVVVGANQGVAELNSQDRVRQFRRLPVPAALGSTSIPPEIRTRLRTISEPRVIVDDLDGLTLAELRQLVQ